MNKNSEIVTTLPKSLGMRDYIALGKLRLASLVVFSAVLGYFIGLNSVSNLNWLHLTLLVLGGFLVTASSNAFNQIWEKDLDAKMDRTKDRPIAAQRLTVLDGFIFAIATGVIGEVCLFLINPLSGWLGLLALVMYVLLYTPMKQINPVAVLIGAFPGSIPPLLGYVAVTGDFGWAPGILFLTQFFWQFPHFWAIAWNINEDYEKASFFMLPTREGRTKDNAFIIFIFTAVTIPIGILPCLQLTPDTQPICNLWAMMPLAMLGVYFTLPAMKLYQTLDKKYAKKLMFASFVYLPLAQICYLIFKL